MTREEAIEVLRANYPDACYSQLREAVDMAIESLSAEPCEDATLKDIFCMGCEYKEQEPCEDAISRQAVFEQINCWIGNGEYRYTNATDYLNRRIKALQAVNPQEKVGYWMPIEYPTGVEAFGVKEMSAQELQCSECGKTVDISDGDFKYCPYCKARMVEPQERSNKE